MRRGDKRAVGLALATALMTSAAARAQAPGAAGGAGSDSPAGDIIVTAQKREQRVNSVPMSITAIKGADLTKQGVTQPADLVKVVSGFSYTVSGYHTPVYILRGLGYFESTLAADPAVSVYVDEIGLPFSTMTLAAGLDPERVEVLKGPQGILFGRNSTGGAINYVAAKPGDRFEAGSTTEIRRFGKFDASGYVSGPISDTLGVRVAVRTEQGGTWQRSYTRDDSIGKSNVLVGRGLFDFKPSDSLRLELNINGWRDHSDNQAPQLAFIVPKNGTLAANHPLTAAYPIAPGNARAADWNPGRSLANRNSQWQVALRGDLDLTDHVILTSLTSYTHYKRYSPMDQDGMIYFDIDTLDTGKIKSFFQEIRLTGDFPKLRPMIGANYSNDNISEDLTSFLGDSSSSPLAGVAYNAFAAEDVQKVRTYAAFGNVEYDIIPKLTLQGGLRYTQADRSFNGCSKDAGDGLVGRAFQILQRVFKGPAGIVVPIPPGACNSLDANLNPTRLITDFNQHNLSWRTGVSWKSDDGLLLYGNVSQGFKSGGFPTTTAATLAQFAPVSQEKVLAYEIGFKAPLADRKVQLNGAAFYYDYTNKQVRGVRPDPVFKTIAALVNVPKSRVAGVELDLAVNPLAGLSFSASGLYLDTKVRRYTGANFRGQIVDFSGSRLPYSPKWQGNLNADYDWALSRGLTASLGGHLSFHGRTNAQLGYYPETVLNGYATLDLSAGIGRSDGRWRATVFGENVTDKYYWNSANNISDVIVRYSALPAVYGLRLTLRN